MNENDDNPVKSSSNLPWTMFQKVSHVFSSVSNPMESPVKSVQQTRDQDHSDSKKDVTGKSKIDESKTGLLNNIVSGSLFGFNQLDTSHTLHPIEDEQIVHHRDVMNPTLHIRSDGYMIPSLSAACARKKTEATIEMETVKVISYCIEDNESNSSDARTEDESADTISEDKTGEQDGGQDAVVVVESDQTTTSQHNDDGRDCNENWLRIDPSVREMISDCAQMKSFCPIPFDEPKVPFKDFQCRPEWNKSLKPGDESSPESMGKEEQMVTEEKPNEFLPGPKKSYPPMPKLSCIPDLINNLSATPENMNDDKKFPPNCYSDYIRLCAKTEFCPSPFDNPENNFNDFVCDPCFKLNLTPEEQAKCLGKVQQSVFPPVPEELPFCEEEFPCPVEEILDEFYEDELPVLVQEQEPILIEEQIQYCDNVPSEDECCIDEDEVVYENFEIPYGEEELNYCDDELQVKSVKQELAECQQNLKCCEEKLLPSSCLTKPNPVNCDEKSTGESIITSTSTTETSGIVGASCESCLYKYFKHILPECDLQETKQQQEPSSSSCEPLKLANPCQDSQKSTECDQQIKFYRQKLYDMQRKLKCVQQKEQHHRQQNCEQQLKYYKFKLAQIQKTLQAVQLRQKELTKKNFEKEQQNKNQSMNNNLSQASTSNCGQCVTSPLPPQCYGQPIPFDSNCCQPLPLYCPPNPQNQIPPFCSPQFQYPGQSSSPPNGPYFGPPLRPLPPQYPFPFQRPSSCGIPGPFENRLHGQASQSQLSVPVQSPFKNTSGNNYCPPLSQIPSQCSRPMQTPEEKNVIVDPCAQELKFCRDKLTSLKKKIFACQGLDPNKVLDENSLERVNEKCDDALLCCRSQIQLNEHKLRTLQYDGECNKKFGDFKENSKKLETEAEAEPQESSKKDPTFISKFKTSCQGSSVNNTSNSTINSIPNSCGQTTNCQQPVQDMSMCYSQISSNPCQPPLNPYAGQGQGQTQVIMNSQNIPYPSQYYPPQYYGSIPLQNYDYYNNQYYNQQYSYNPQNYPNYYQNQYYTYSQQQQQQQQRQFESQGPCGSSYQQPENYSNNCVQPTPPLSFQEPTKCNESTFTEMRDKVNACWNKFDQTPTTKYVHCETPEQIYKAFKTSNPNVKYPEFDEAAKRKCPDSLKQLSEAQRKTLIRTGMSQYDLRCFDTTYNDKKQMNDNLHNSMCKCAACTTARYGDFDEDEAHCDPMTCRECGAKLDEEGHPIEEEEDPSSNEETLDTKQPKAMEEVTTTPNILVTTYRKIFPRWKNANDPFEWKNGRPVLEGGMSADRLRIYYALIDKLEDESETYRLGLPPAEEQYPYPYDPKSLVPTDDDDIEPKAEEE